MKIEVAANDLFRLRRVVAEKHSEIAHLPVMSSDTPGFQGTRDCCVKDMTALRKLHNRLTLAIREVEGHDCHPETLARLT